jgi:hypothetical protein
MRLVEDRIEDTQRSQIPVVGKLSTDDFRRFKSGQEYWNEMIDDGTSLVKPVTDLGNAFGDGWTKVTVGSGISKTDKMVRHPRIDGLSAGDPSLSEMLPWSENQTLVSSLFEGIYQRSRVCPGRDKPQCCGAEVEQEHCSPSWREREDPEWYAQQLNIYLTLLNRRMAAGSATDPRLVADAAFELGCLFTEALIKFQWDRHAKRGLGTLNSAAAGGAARRSCSPTRRAGSETVAAVDKLLAGGMSSMLAYKTVAAEQGVSDQTIRKEYRLEKK